MPLAKIQRWFGGAVVSVLLGAILASVAESGGPAAWQDRSATLTIRSYGGEDQVRERTAEIQEKLDAEGAISLLMELSSPSDVHGTRILEIPSAEGEAGAWVWSPGTRRVRRMTREIGTESSFYGTEMTYRDAQILDVLPRLANKAEVKVVGEEKLDGQLDTVVLDVVLAGTSRDGHYRVWVSQEDRSIRRIDVGEKEGVVDRRILVTSLERLGDRPTPTKIEVISPSSGDRVVLERSAVRYDTDIPERTFSMANLSRGR
jgi:hypothetical protein